MNYKIISYNQTLGYLTASLFSLSICFAPNAQALPQKSSDGFNIKNTKYITQTVPSTYDQNRNGLTGDFTNNADPFVEAVTNFYSRLLIDQTRLDSDFEQILHSNLWDLYES